MELDKYEELKNLLIDLYTHYKDTSIVDNGGETISCHECGNSIDYDPINKTFPEFCHKDNCPTKVMASRIKTFLKSVK